MQRLGRIARSFAWRSARPCAACRFSVVSSADSGASADAETDADADATANKEPNKKGGTTNWVMGPDPDQIGLRPRDMASEGGINSHWVAATSASDSQDDATRAAVRITAIGMGVNGVLAVSKGAAGVTTGSAALVADGIHSLSDLLSDVLTVIAVKLARMPPDEDHPFGHGKFETIGALSMGCMLVIGGGAVGWDAYQHICEYWANWEAASVGAKTMGGDAVAPSVEAWLAAGGVACASILSKEALYWKTVEVGRKINSSTLVANAWHHRMDALSSVVALVGIGGAAAGLPLLDPAAAAVVAGMVAKAGIEIGRDALAELSDASVTPPEVIAELREAALRVSDVRRVRRLRVRSMGPYLVVDMSVVVDPRLSLSAAQQVGLRVKSALSTQVKSCEVSEAMVYVDADDSEHNHGSDAAVLQQQSPVQGAYDEDDASESTAALAALAARQMRAVRQAAEARAALRTAQAAARAARQRGELMPVMRSPSDIEADVERVVVTRVPEVRSVSHMLVHWLPTRGASMVEVEIVVDPGLQVHEVHDIARRARRLIIDCVEDVNDADLHLELNDRREDERTLDVATSFLADN